MTTTIEVHEKTDVILPGKESSSSNNGAVCWGAIFAGAAGAASLSLILILLGSGLGFSAISPWSNDGVSAKTFGISGILWITLTSLAASGMGGYLAGRLRTRWASTDRDEVYFRDTAHGFLAWGIATLFTAGLLTSSIAMLVGGGVKAGAEIAKSVSSSPVMANAITPEQFGLRGDATTYFIETLFRKSNEQPITSSAETTSEQTNNENNVPVENTTSTNTTDRNWQAPTPRQKVPTAEVARIFLNALRVGSLSNGDAQYIATRVADHANISQVEAEERVKIAFNQWQSKLREVETTTKEAADEARKATAYLSLWFFIALLIGAFTASWLATYGGRQRDL